MKFARYLQDTQTPEWKKAYIDYRGLKKKIGAIRTQQLQLEAANSTATTDVERAHPAKDFAAQASNLPNLPEHITPQSHHPIENTSTHANDNVNTSINNNPDAIAVPGAIRKRNSRHRPSLTLKLTTMSRSHSTNPHRQGSTSTPAAPQSSYAPAVYPFFRDLGSPTHPTPPLHVLIPLLPPLHAEFFAFLDLELEKIDSFYAEREREMKERGRKLHEQLNQLRDHRKAFYESNAASNTQAWANKAHLSLPAAILALTQQPNPITVEPAGRKSGDIPGRKSIEFGRKSLEANSDLEDKNGQPEGPSHPGAANSHKPTRAKNGKSAQRHSHFSTSALSSDTSDNEDTDGGNLSSPSSPSKSLAPLHHEHVRTPLTSSSGKTLVQPNSAKLTSTFKHGTGADVKHISGSLSPKHASGATTPKHASGATTPKHANGATTPKHAAGTATPKHVHGATTPPKHDPQEYQDAKKKLKRAVVEYYRGLEVLNNYRVLNLTGFRKALKKYEKVTKVPAQQAYMREKVEPSAFASGATVNDLLKEMEELFAARFERGDKKRALNRLRIGSAHKSHHFSTFRSGLWLGLAAPAVVTGFILCFNGDTREVMPAWNILLFIYSILLIPVLFALLIGFNVLVWAQERINYSFIFELDLRSRLDHREYFELPSSFLCALAYAFLLSFARVGDPLIWPLIWLAVVIGVMFNPIKSLMWGRTRWWTIKNVAKLGGSGFWTVEFTDFWLGDQFCSLVYTLSNLYFVGCFYTRYFPSPPSFATSAPTPTSSPAPFPSLLASPYNASVLPYSNIVQRGTVGAFVSSAYDPAIQQAWETCGTADNWGIYFVLGTLPFLARFVQSIRRYYDSRLSTHLINAGKYGMGLIYYFFYYYWRHQGNLDRGPSVVVWCLTATIYALYACAWDFLMDWSICKPHARYPLLRPELVYTTQIPMYYFALISNLLIRFIWVLYIPERGPNLTLRTFIAALLEMLRRIQWNFYRLENEHLGNMDQYRVTREVPLPYHFDTGNSNGEDEDDEVDGDEDAVGTSWLRRQLTRDSKKMSQEMEET